MFLLLRQLLYRLNPLEGLFPADTDLIIMNLCVKCPLSAAPGRAGGQAGRRAVTAAAACGAERR